MSGGARIIDTSTLGPIKVDPVAETAMDKAVAAVMKDRGCHIDGSGPCLGYECSCRRLARVVLEAVGLAHP